jgi:alginate O-acetyltransferase complex protein AlgI
VVFSSTLFLFAFLPIFLGVYFAAPGIAAKNVAALAFSLLFYAWGEPVLVLVLIFSIVFNWAAARDLDRQEGRARTQALAGIVAVDLGLLAVFKYLDFLGGIIGLDLPPIPLPLGISFFTFHCLSYVIDVYRRRFPANRSLPQIALYIALFPQLVAGPIVRYATVARQLQARRFELGRASAGMRIVAIGLSQKVLIADQIAPLADAAFDHSQWPGLAESWLGLLAYTLQIYFDFAGYSNIAIGLGLVLGFTLPRNFRLPYTALSMTDFWRRWHMSLTRWLRDYLYIPLGGNRGAPWQTWRNLVIVFFLCGLWHGAAWTFVFWGVWHGVFLVLERASFGKVLLRLPAVLRWTYTMAGVMGGWVLFRAADLGAAGQMYRGLCGANGIGPLDFSTHVALTPLAAIAVVTGCLLATLPRWTHMLPTRLPERAVAVADTVFTFGALFLSCLAVAANSYSPFLYFRF